MEKNILMIDDDLDDFLFFKDYLKNFPDYRCQYARDANTGISMMAEQRPAVVLLDLNMPAVNGMECLLIIKSRAAISDIPVIVFSTFISENQNDVLLNNGAACCLQKPKHLDGYNQVVQKIAQLVQFQQPE